MVTTFTQAGCGRCRRRTSRRRTVGQAAHRSQADVGERGHSVGAEVARGPCGPSRLGDVDDVGLQLAQQS